MRNSTIALAACMLALLLAGCQTSPATEKDQGHPVNAETFPFGVLGPPPGGTPGADRGQ